MGAYSTLHNLTYQEIRKHFPHYTIRENIRPDWLVSSNLTKLELDLYIEEINTAIEVQGLQHYEFTPHFHKTYADFEKQKQRDQEKRDLCYGKKVKLVEIAAWMDLHIFINELLESHSLPMLQKSAVEDAGFREEIKAKRAARKARRKELREAFCNVKFPGTQKQRKHAREALNSNLMLDGRWVVWGGNNTHIMTHVGDNIYCNCRHAKENNNDICSHRIRIMMDTGSYPVQKKRTRKSKP